MSIDQDTLERIQNAEWHQDWSGLYLMLEASLDNQPDSGTYFDNFEGTFGRSITEMLLFFKEDQGTGWLPVEEYESVGSHMANAVLEASNLNAWKGELEKYYELIRVLLALPPEQLLSRISQYKVLYPKIGPYVIGFKMAFDFLPPGHEEIAQKILALRKHSETLYFDTAKAMDALCGFVAERVGYPQTATRRMTVDELETYAKQSVVPDLQTLGKRSVIGGLYVRKNVVIELSSAVVTDIERAWASRINEYEIRGVAAYPGVVRAQCRLVTDYRTAALQDGEVLVTKMTDPYFVPLMKKAAAIVADNGGMLSHAAIVARELKIPCIVGTKMATKFLKDGDMVEVDADNGIVRKI